MPKYLLLKHYTGGPENNSNLAPMTEWSQQDITAHLAFQRHVGDLLRRRGELVDVRVLGPTGTYVRYGGPGAAPVTTDGPFPETKELAAGWFLVDVESEAWAHEIAAYVSSAPGRGGEPVCEWIEVRPVLDAAPAALE